MPSLSSRSFSLFSSASGLIHRLLHSLTTRLPVLPSQLLVLITIHFTFKVVGTIPRCSR